MKTLKKACLHALVALGLLGFARGAYAAYTEDCITFSSANAFTLAATKGWNGTLWTSTDKTNWTIWDGIEVSAVDDGTGTFRLYVRGDAANTVISDWNAWTLTGSGIACTGNLETLRGATGDAPSPTAMEEYCYMRMFKDCTALKSSPALPATTLASNCYYEMFYGCMSLETPPALPAEAMEQGCYRSMFYGCTSLKKAPTLPAETLAPFCYEYMFKGCTALESAPELKAETLTEYCYYEMFDGCTSLAEAGAISARMFANDSCGYMFRGCTALETAPTIFQATTMAYRCCNCMFFGCTSLKKVPALPATELEQECYYQMFDGCTSLTDLPALPATTLPKFCYQWMFSGCTALKVNTTSPGKPWVIPTGGATGSDALSGMFRYTGGTMNDTPERGVTYYVGDTADSDFITFSSANAFTLAATKKWNGTLWTSTDKTNWTIWDGAVVSAADDGTGTYRLHVRGDAANTVISDGNAWTLTGSGISCTGNLETLRGATGDAPSPTAMEENCYSHLFYECVALTEAPTLSALTLADYCYYFAFYGCTSLKKAPALPAETLALRCYCYMFSDCTALVEAGAISARVFAKESCYYMFQKCSALEVAPTLAQATTMAELCCYDMFLGCTSLKQAPELPAMELDKYCYQFMFNGCTALTDLPALPATTLPTCCYEFMFYNCTALKVNTTSPGKPWVLPTGGVTGEAALRDMFSGTGGTMNTTPTRGVTYYVLSALEVVPVTYHAMGGIHADGLECKTLDTVIADGYAFPSAPKRDGYTFRGWFASWKSGAAEVKEGDALVTLADHALYAQWQPVATPGGLNLPDLVDGQPNTTIADGAYNGNTSVSSVVTPLYMTTIGQYAFQNCTALKSLTITAARSYDDLSPVSVTIGRNAFAGCSSLEELYIASEVSSIGQSAFQNCAKLRKIVFGGSGTISCGSSAFRRCGYDNGTGKIEVFMSPSFKDNNATFIGQLTTWFGESGVEIVLKVDVTPATGITGIEVDFTKLGPDRKLAVMVKTTVSGKPDVTTVDIQHTATLSPADWKTLKANDKTAFADGSVLVEITVPSGNSGFLRAVAK